MINLSEAQSKVVFAPIGEAMQVLASAGSGKTRVLTERIRHILKNTKKEGVVGLTFTNKAAEEMNERLDDLPDIQERCWIATIHSVAQRIVDQYGHVIGLPSELHLYERDEDRKTVFIQSLIDDGIDIDEIFDTHQRTADRSKTIQKYMDAFSSIKRSLLSESDIICRHAQNPTFISIYRKYQEALLNSGGIDFDDILVYAHKILIEQPWCGDIYRAKYKHICVDEAQDLNKAQYEFIKALAGGKLTSVMMVGDPNQMIYGFNSSSQEFLCTAFLEDFPAIKYSLVENYRSSIAVVEWANKLKPGSQLGMTAALPGYSQIQECADEEHEATLICNVVNKIINLKQHAEIEGDITLDNIVIIGRNRFVFKALESKLKTLQIPYFLKKGELRQPPSSRFGKALDLAIRLKLNPKDWIDGQKLCALLKLNTAQDWGDRLLLEKLASDIPSAPLSDIYSKLLMFVSSLDVETPNIPKLFLAFENDLKKYDKNNSDDIGIEIELSLFDLVDFRDSWTTFKRKGLGTSLIAFRNAMALGQLSEPVQKNGLTLSTVHTMKGLEKDIVFVIGMCDGIFPDYRAKSKQEIDEERNNAFVAITRARRWIYITYPTRRMMPWGDVKLQRRSRFIDELTR